MRRLCKSVTGVTLLAMMAFGCGSTNHDDELVFHFVGWDNEGITQQDEVRQSSADVDVIQDCCTCAEGSDPCLCTEFEPITQTAINAVFRNEEASDIRLDRYVIHVNDRESGLADISGSLSGVLIGGRCSTDNTPCTVSADCTQSGAGGETATCNHTDTTISSILLFDFTAKAHVSPEVFGRATSLTVTFFGSDANTSFQTTAGYVVTFGDFDNCSTTTGGGAGAS